MRFEKPVKIRPVCAYCGFAITDQRCVCFDGNEWDACLHEACWGRQMSEIRPEALRDMVDDFKRVIYTPTQDVFPSVEREKG